MNLVDCWGILLVHDQPLDSLLPEFGEEKRSAPFSSESSFSQSFNCFSFFSYYFACRSFDCVPCFPALLEVLQYLFWLVCISFFLLRTLGQLFAGIVKYLCCESRQLDLLPLSSTSGIRLSLDVMFLPSLGSSSDDGLLPSDTDGSFC